MTTSTPHIATPWRLKIVSAALLPLWLIQSALRSISDGGWTYLRQRTGFYTNATKVETDDGVVSDPDQLFCQQPADAVHIWIHCASVGEVKTVLPLIKLLSDRSAGIGNALFTVTTLTPTGKELLEQMHDLFAATAVRHCYLPIDHGFSTKRFLHRYRPHYALIVETEIWPRLYHACLQLQIPLAIVNGRLSQKTERVKNGLAGKLIAPLLADALASVEMVLSRSSEDAIRFEDLLTFSRQHLTNTTVDSAAKKTGPGNRPAIHVCGNLKDLSTEHATPAKPPLTGPFCLLASTHEDEEIRLSKAWQALQRNELLVIVPRHPERGISLRKQIQAEGLQVVLRSESDGDLANSVDAASESGVEVGVGVGIGGEEINSKDLVYIADTLGELERFYQHASAVFVGGSLASIGGHNIFEAARVSCAMVVGPHMHNFEAEFSALQEANAIVQVDTAEAVIKQLCLFLDNPQQARETARAAAAVVREKAERSDVADNYMGHLLSFMDQQTVSSRS